MQHRQERGFIAIISAVIIGGVLMLIAASMGLSSIYSRSNLLDAELKERADAAADACVDTALLQIAQDATYAGGTYSINTLDVCRVGKVTTVGTNYQFYVQATSSDTAVTDLLVQADTSDLSIKKWQEVTTY